MWLKQHPGCLPGQACCRWPDPQETLCFGQVGWREQGREGDVECGSSSVQTGCFLLLLGKERGHLETGDSHEFWGIK